MPFLFENLDAYQKAIQLSIEISKITDTFPKGNYYLVDQLNRAALSISANIAEGNGRWHTNDKKQFFWIARGSVQECVPILEICRGKALITDAACDRIKQELDNLGKMTSGLIKRIETLAVTKPRKD